jgi:L-asparaginase
MKDNILVIFTGGTIGSRKDGGIIDVEADTAYELLERYGQSGGDSGVRFETRQPLTILSENLNPNHWLQMIDCLREVDFSAYAGIIVTHGSDTLPYTAAMLSYVFCAIPVPLVLVAANYPLADARSNGLRNFGSAVDFIRDLELPGIFAVYENERSEAIVHLGTRLTEALPFTDQFDSTYAAPFGRMTDRKFVPNPHEVNPDAAYVRQRRQAIIDPGRIRFSNEVLYIKPYPGLNYSLYDWASRKPKAVLHGVYHSATANNLPAGSFSSSLTEFAEMCREHGVDLYTAPGKDEGADLYHSAGIFKQIGLAGLKQVGVEAAIVKLMLAYGTFDDRQEREAFLNRSVFFEIHEGGAW